MLPMLYIAGLIAAAMIAWSIGANDMANSTSVVIGSGVLKFRTAFILFSVSQLMGALIQGYMVMKTLGKGIVPEIDVIGAIAASLAAFIWIMIATVVGAPISTTHSITGGIIGIGLAYMLFDTMTEITINLLVIRDIILSWVVSPLMAMILAMPLYYVVKRFYDSVKVTEKRNKFNLFVVLFSAFSAYSFGANDVANATGVYITVTSRYFGLLDEQSMRLLALYSSFFIVLGGLILGYKVVNTLAFKITKLNIPMAIAAGFANAFTVWIFTTIPYLILGYGLPISTTYAAAGSIIGVGIAKSKSFHDIDKKTLVFIISSWMFTLPITMMLGLGIYYLLAVILGVGL
ncbi:MAG: anion permease [Thermoprotei archaeon]|jgi:PiT family inorganic phosphate transporter